MFESHTITDRYGNACETVMVGDLYAPPADGTIAHDTWRYVVDSEGKRTGRVVRVSGRSIAEVVGELTQALVDADMIDEYFGLCTAFRHAVESGKASPEWPDHYRWIACYAVTGGSEGHYIHVDIVSENGKFGSEADWKRTPIALGKTFRGMAHAQAIAAKCAELLGA